MIIQVCRVKVVEEKRVKRVAKPETATQFFKIFGSNPSETLRKLLGKSWLEDEDKKGARTILWDGKGGDNPDLGDTNWGKMVVRKEKLTKTERHHSFRHRYSYVGPFRYPHRALLPISDGRAWHHRASGKGGTVLIDWSGSMSLTSDQILKVLRNNPLATVGAYHSLDGN